MKRFNKIYLEISNLCNLSCTFCPGTKRKKHAMTVEEFSSLLPKLRPYADYLYFHLMGEPLLHPNLESFLRLAGEAGFKVILTTNGSLLHRQQEMLLRSPALHKVNISLHAFEANDLTIPFAQYLSTCFSFGKAAEGNVLTVFRLWNQGGADERNQEILTAMEDYFPKPWHPERKGTRLGNRVYLEYGDKFDWPDLSAPEGTNQVFCYGLRDQIGILCDGTVVPCCLDHEGDLSLGNLHDQTMEDILASPRAKAIYDGFRHHQASEELCRKCGYARRFG
ncbi:MAG: SPASM domain-containing protein [Oscillospiraceae bacterium]|nr:SPASM domain-containing protein [Oscillospiraceae bacterium]